jgi:MEDS: MEthanogen/methylotroph, DcmR Sensory domain
VTPDQRRDHPRRLAAVGIDTAAAEQHEQFEFRTNTETYLPDGRFDQDRMLEVFEQLAGGNATDRRQRQCTVSLTVKRAA